MSSESPFNENELPTVVRPFADPLRYGRYTLVGRIGRGGMAEVFLATMEGAKGVRRRCVVKRIRPDKAPSPYFAQMFADEARITAALHHPNIIQVYEFAEIGNLLFLALEHLAGKSLGAVLTAMEARGWLLPPPMAAHIAQQVARGLHHAHTLTGADGAPLGVIHRDIGPNNIILVRTGEVKIVDFGVAKADPALKQGLTFAGRVKGTRLYMAPEQLSDDEVDFRADIFSLGVVLWEMLTGEPLFAGRDGRARRRRLLQGEVPLPSRLRPSISPRLDAIVCRCLQPSPAARYPSAEALAEALGLVVREALLDTEELGRLVRELYGAQELEPTVVQSDAGDGTLSLDASDRQSVSPTGVDDDSSVGDPVPEPFPEGTPPLSPSAAARTKLERPRRKIPAVAVVPARASGWPVLVAGTLVGLALAIGIVLHDRLEVFDADLALVPAVVPTIITAPALPAPAVAPPVPPVARVRAEGTARESPAAAPPSRPSRTRAHHERRREEDRVPSVQSTRRPRQSGDHVVDPFGSRPGHPSPAQRR